MSLTKGQDYVFLKFDQPNTRLALELNHCIYKSKIDEKFSKRKETLNVFIYFLVGLIPK
jgi:hypothetical protein